MQQTSALAFEAGLRLGCMRAESAKSIRVDVICTGGMHNFLTWSTKSVQCNY